MNSKKNNGIDSTIKIKNLDGSNQSIVKGFIDNLRRSKQGSKLSINEILVSMITNDDNIALKSDIPDPYNLTLLKTFSDFFVKHEFVDISDSIETLINWFLQYRISKDGKSREDTYKTLSFMRNKEENEEVQDLSTIKKLTTNLK